MIRYLQGSEYWKTYCSLISHDFNLGQPTEAECDPIIKYFVKSVTPHLKMRVFIFLRYEQFTWEDHRPTTGTWKGTAGGDVYSFSGCDDNQTVVDTSVSLLPKP
jgi:hypothetical protein